MELSVVLSLFCICALYFSRNMPRCPRVPFDKRNGQKGKKDALRSFMLSQGWACVWFNTNYDFISLSLIASNFKRETTWILEGRTTNEVTWATGGLTYRPWRQSVLYNWKSMPGMSAVVQGANHPKFWQNIYSKCSFLDAKICKFLWELWFPQILKTAWKESRQIFVYTVHTGYNAIGYSAKSDIVPTLTHMWGGPN